MKISILGIGTELTTGQILNRNGQWISQQLQRLGVPTAMHLVVPDEEALILESMGFCANHADVVFITGGLGPTSDDFTRDVVSKWTSRPLVWDEASWQHLSERLTSRGYHVRDIQRQQCYFPEGSRILKNRLGTANAFHLSFQGKDIYVLPGPPGEIAAVWEDHIDAEMKRKAQNVDALITRSWDTIGYGESDIADRVESVLLGCPLEKGYRVHLPFVEFKVTYLKSQSPEAEKWISKIDQCLAPMTVLRDNEESAQKLAESLSGFEHILICDEIPGSFLINRLFPFSKKLLKDKKFNFITHPPAKVNPKTLFLHLREDSPKSAWATLKYQGQSRSQQFTSPYRSLLLKEREQQFYAEMALIFWMKEAQLKQPVVKPQFVQR